MIVVSTSQGTEDILIDEIRSLGYQASFLKPSKVVVKGSLKDIVHMSLHLRQAHRIGVLLYEGKASTLEEIQKAAKEIDLSWIPKGSFAIRGRRFGSHPFTSIDIGKTVGDIFWEYFRKVDLKHPNWEFFAELSGEHFMIYLNMVGSSMHKRYRRFFSHAAPLKPSIAASLIYLSSFLKKKEMLDPVAGSGTIGMEACYMSKGAAPGLFLENFAFEQFPDLKEYYLKLYHNLDVADCGSNIILGDISPKYIKGMKINTKKQIIPCECEIYMKDATLLNYPYVPELVIANPPYGLRMGTRNKIHKLYERFAQALRKQDVREVIVFTAENEKMKKELENQGYEIVLYRRVLYGRLNTYIIKGLL